MPTITDADLAARVLDDLYVSEAGEPDDAEEQAVALQKVAQVREEGRLRGLVYWAENENPLGLVQVLIDIVGLRCLKPFNLGEPTEDDLEMSWRPLARLVAEPYRARTTRALHI